MSHTLGEIRGVRERVADHLGEAGVRTLGDLVALRRDDARRHWVARKTGLAPATLMRFVGMAEVLSLDGVTGPQAEVLFNAGIDSFEKLRTERKDRLVRVLQPVDPFPTETLTRWVRQGPVTGAARR